jgi:hypothetical protein
MPLWGAATPEVLKQHSLIRKRIKPDVLNKIKNLRQANVVLHCDLNPGPRARHLAAMFGQDLPTTVPDSAAMQLISCPAKPQSAFAHWKIKTTVGTVLVFNSWHIIRSGGGSHACAITSLLRFVNFLRAKHPSTHSLVWPSLASIPNTVYAAQFINCIDPMFKNAPCATHTSKFPGIAIELSMVDKVTPELFLKASKFILPGVKTADVLGKALESLVSLTKDYTSTSYT